MIDRAAVKPLMKEQTSKALLVKASSSNGPRMVRVEGSRLGKIRKYGVRPPS